ncbi:restriction endonuclease subunit S [Sediminibacterium sp. C3]|uniref:restriction endonuclease subunit S n=1 Tax=Sediminibacterium sp. C3 TaxID=1267211 RepID=UPI0004018203|nr:restriction endonuclease subunit S [Sediminibacterium sp. C3]
MSQVELTTLGKSCDFFNGKAHEKSIDENGNYIVVNSKFISSEGKSFKRTNEQMFPLYKGDIVMVMSDVPNGKALAKCFIIDKVDTYSLNQRICCIRSKEFDTKYLYYQLNRNVHFLAFNNGENQTNLRKDDILACPLIKPSMEEQKRMVAELDNAYSKIESAIINVEANLKNAKFLFDNYLSSLFENNEYRWEQKKLKDVAEYFNGLTYSPKDVSQNGTIVLRSSNIQNDKLDFDDIVRVNTKIKEKIFVQEGDILMCSRNGSKHLVGKTAPINNLHEKMTFGTFMMIIRSEYNPFLLWFFKTDDFKRQISQGEYNMINQITRYMLDDVIVLLPEIEKQKEIVKNLNTLNEQVLKLTLLYNSKIELLAELKSGILKRAFENELIEAE